MDFTEKLLRRIVGVEVAVERIEGRSKYSQNEREDDRRGVIAGLAASPGLAEQQVAAVMSLQKHGGGAIELGGEVSTATPNGAAWQAGL